MNGEDNELLQLVTTTYGPLLSQKQLAEFLKRSHPRVTVFAPLREGCQGALKACSRRVGRRVYYPAPEVARIITGRDTL